MKTEVKSTETGNGVQLSVWEGGSDSGFSEVQVINLISDPQPSQHQEPHDSFLLSLLPPGLSLQDYATFHIED